MCGEQFADLGPYVQDYNCSGRYLVLAGRKGHLAIMDWKQARLIMELQVRETVRDVKYLHNELFFAVAQKKYVYIYDKKGVEIHCLRVGPCLRFHPSFLYDVYISLGPLCNLLQIIPAAVS
jgi:hypothetical protein